MENTVTIRIQSDASGITLLAYIQTEHDLVVEHVDIAPTESVIMATANRLEGWDA
jgi:hypothetical protein